MNNHLLGHTPRWWRGVVASVALTLLPISPAFAQPAQPATSARTPKLAPKAAPSAAASPSSTAPAPQASPTELVPGHPPVDDDDESPPVESPHGHMGGEGHAPSGRGGMGFEPVPDGVEPDPTLAPGTISISIRNADDVPLAGVNLVLGIIHNSVAKGESRDRKEARTDDSGTAVITGLDVGGGHSYRVSSSVGPGTFEVQPFSLTDKAGMRVVLHLYELTEDLSRVRVAMSSSLSVSMKEDVMAVDVTYNIFNVSPAAWLADVDIPLPAGFKAFNTSEDQAQTSLKVMQTATGAVLRGTVSPGQTEVGFRFHIPLSGQEAQDIDFSLFPNTVQTQLAVEASKKMRLLADSFPPAQLSRTQDGRQFLFTKRGLQAGPLNHFKATIGGLPSRGPGGYIAVALAIVAILSAGIYRLLRVGRTDLPDDAYQDLIEARETLIDEIASLERTHATGRIGPKSYARARTLLTDALARIMVQLDSADSGRLRAAVEKKAAPKNPKSGPQGPIPPQKPRKKRPAQASV